MDGDCPCGSGTLYEDCCARLHRGEAAAATAEALMRSRFSAFAVGDPGYLMESWDPGTRPASIELEAGLEWRRLRILDVVDGTPTDDSGVVEFVAHFWDSTQREYGRHHERSRFRRTGGRWRYVDGEPGGR